MAKNTGIDMDVIMALVEEGADLYGLSVEVKAAWIALRSKSNDKTLYFAKQKRCRTITICGFGKQWIGTTPPPAPNGRVEAHVDFDNEHVISHIRMLIAAMATLPKVERKKVNPMTGMQKKPRIELPVPEDIVDRAARLTLLRKVAEEKGMAISAATVATLEE